MSRVTCHCEPGPPITSQRSESLVVKAIKPWPDCSRYGPGEGGRGGEWEEGRRRRSVLFEVGDVTDKRVLCTIMVTNK